MSRDKSRVLPQEWSVESFTMWGIAALVVIATASASDAAVTAWVYRCSAGLLLALSILTSLTGARTSVTWFKICPVLLTCSLLLLLIASLL
jgi:hypothetical protein